MSNPLSRRDLRRYGRRDPRHNKPCSVAIAAIMVSLAAAMTASALLEVRLPADGIVYRMDRID